MKKEISINSLSCNTKTTCKLLSKNERRVYLSKNVNLTRLIIAVQKI